MSRVLLLVALVLVTLGMAGGAAADRDACDGPDCYGNPLCSDGVDNDSDGKIDYPVDAGCWGTADNDEVDAPPPPPPPPSPACSDGIDNDGDLYTDWWGDVGCWGNPGHHDESDWSLWAQPGIVPADSWGGFQSQQGNLRCYTKESERTRGILTYTRRLYLLTSWCAANGKILSRVSTHRTHHDSWCWNHTGPQTRKTAGGVGSTFVDVQAWVEIECASVPTYFPKWHDTLMLRMRYLPNGYVQRLAYE
jgi:hypothetical protein